MPLPDDLNFIPADLDLVGQDGNAFSVLGQVRRALIKAGNPPETVKIITDEMMSSNYDYLLGIAMEVTR